MIQQQYYTRERRGLFRSAEGYDSIAKSDGLSDEFIKDSIHQFCFYSPPLSMVQEEEQDASRYPKSLISVPLFNGQRLIGCAVHVPADFTGLRNTFFMHNFIIPQEEKELFLLNPDKILNIKAFVTSYDIENGKVLPELTDIPFAKKSRQAEKISEQLKISKQLWKEMLLSIFEAVGGNKKIYIAPDCEMDQLTDAAKDCLYVLLKCLPPDVLTDFGFSTYVKERIDLEGLHLMFLPKKTIKPNESMPKRDIFFDLESGQSVNVSQGCQSVFLDFCIENMEKPEGLEQFFSFGRFFLTHLKREDRIKLSVYDDLTRLYAVKQNMQQAFFSYNEDIFNKLTTYANEESMVFYQRLLDYECTMMAKAQEYLSSLSVVQNFIAFHELKINSSKNIDYIAAFCMKNIDLAAEAIRLAEGKAIYRGLIKTLVTTQSQEPFRVYFASRLADIKQSDAFMLELAYWDMVLENPCEGFYEALGQKLKEITESTTNPIETAADILNGITNELKESESLKGFVTWMVSYMDAYLFKAIDITTLDFEDMQKFPEAFLVRNSNRVVCEAIFCLNRFYREINTITFSPQAQINEIKHLSTDASLIARFKIREMLKDRIYEDTYMLIAFSFAEEKKEMLDFVRGYNKKELASFLLWCTRNNVLNVDEDNDYTVTADCIRRSISDSAFKTQIYTSSQLKQIAKAVKPSFLETLTRKR